MDYEILIPISIIIVGGTLIYWIQFWTGGEHNMWVLPWLFGAIVAGGYLGWFNTEGAIIWGRIIAIVVGCVLGMIMGFFGLITDPRIEEGPVKQYFTMLGLLSLPIGVVVGTQFRSIGNIPGPAIGFCLVPLVLIALDLLLISLPKKIFAWLRKI